MGRWQKEKYKFQRLSGKGKYRSKENTKIEKETGNLPNK